MLGHNNHWLFLQLFSARYFCQIWLYFNLEVDIIPAAYIKAKQEKGEGSQVRCLPNYHCPLDEVAGAHYDQAGQLHAAHRLGGERC